MPIGQYFKQLKNGNQYSFKLKNISCLICRNLCREQKVKDRTTHPRGKFQQTQQKQIIVAAATNLAEAALMEAATATVGAIKKRR